MIGKHRVVALAGLLCGCAVGPDYRAPEISFPEAFRDQVAASANARALAEWWGVFDDARLGATVERVLAANLDVVAAVERVETARAAYGVAAADRLPTLDARGSYQRTRPFLGLPGQTAPTQDLWSIGAGLSWEIDLFGRVRRSVEAAAADLDSQVEDLRDVQVLLIAETVATYLQIVSIQERLEIARRNVEGQERSLDIANRRQEAGMASGLDPAQARVNLFSTQSAVPELELALRRGLHRLAVLQGRDPSTDLGLVADGVALPAMPETLMVGVPADLLRNRPDIRSLERQLAAQTARVGAATATLYPAINLSGAWDWLARSPSSLFDAGTGSGDIGPLVSLPIFNAGRLRSRVRAEEAAVRQIDAALRQRVLVAQEEVENALVAIVRDRRQVVLLRDAVAAARESVALSRQLYTSGQSDFQNVLDAERSLFSLEDQLASVRLAALLDLVELYRAIGGGWGGASREITNVGK